MQVFYDISFPLEHNQQETVEALILNYNGEAIFTELPKFTNLKSLEINLHKPLPSDSLLGDLSNLESLTIRYSLRDIKPITRLKKLKQLSIVQVQTEGFYIPADIGALVQLERLTLQNLLIKDLPAEISRLKELKYLDISYCKAIETLPATLFQLNGLEHLYLNNTSISTLSEDIAELKDLKFLDLADTNISELPENFGAYYQGDFTLSMSNAKIGGDEDNLKKFIKELHSKVLDTNKRKVFFNLYCGYYERIDKEVHLAYIYEAMNFSYKILRLNAVSYWYRHNPSPFPTAQEAILYLTPMQEFKWDWDTLKPLLSTHKVEISNRLNKTVTHVVVGAKPGASLEKAQQMNLPIVSQGHLKDFILQLDDSIYLHHTDSTTLEMAINLRNLLRSEDTSNMELGLQMALGGGLNASYFYDILLMYIWNYNNNVSKLACKVLERFLPIDAFLHLKSVRQTRQDYATEEQVSRYLNLIAQHSYFEVNDLAINFYDNFSKGYVFCLKHPKSFLWYCDKKRKNSVLRLIDLGIEGLPKAVGTLRNIKILYLQKNKLRNLPTEFANLAQLDTLNLDNNEIDFFPEALTELPKLASLSIAHNMLKSLPANISKLQTLETLNIAHNDIRKIPEEIFDLPALRYLDISHNPIRRYRKTLEEKMPYCKIVG